jgi:glycerol-3-phosphate acyltransferase PlsY
VDYVLLALAAVVGYLSGSVSYARVVTRLVAEEEVKPLELVTPDGGAKIVSPTISATAVRLQLGAKWGLTVAFADIAKAFVPTLVFYLLYPDQPYYLAAATFAPIGHNWPVFHGFRGGAGQSCILGGLLVIDWVGVVATSVVSQVVGLWVIRDGVIADAGGIFLIIPWLWWRTGFDPWTMAYAFIVNIAFWTAYWPNLKQYLDAKRAGHLPIPEDAMVMFGFDYPFMRKLSPKKYAEVDARAAAAAQRASLQGEPAE